MLKTLIILGWNRVCTVSMPSASRSGAGRTKLAPTVDLLFNNHLRCPNCRSDIVRDVPPKVVFEYTIHSYILYQLLLEEIKDAQTVHLP